MMDQIQLANTLLNIPPEKVLPIFSQMDPVKLAEALQVIPPKQLLSILTDVPKEERDKVLKLYKKLVQYFTTIKSVRLRENSFQSFLNNMFKADVPIVFKYAGSNIKLEQTEVFLIRQQI